MKGLETVHYEWQLDRERYQKSHEQRKYQARKQDNEQDFDLRTAMETPPHVTQTNGMSG